MTFDTSIGTSRKWSRKLAFCSGSNNSSRAAAGSPWSLLLPILSTYTMEENSWSQIKVLNKLQRHLINRKHSKLRNMCLFHLLMVGYGQIQDNWYLQSSSHFLHLLSQTVINHATVAVRDVHNSFTCILLALQYRINKHELCTLL